MSNQEHVSRIKVVTKISDPPMLSSAGLSRLQQESAQLHAAFTARTARMEILTAEDLSRQIRSSCVRG